jgi:hypothetical protein
MFLRETIEHCGQCRENTPHCRRLVAIPKVLSIVAVLVAIACFARDGGWWRLGVLLLIVTGLLLLYDRDRCWVEHCVRCRDRARAKLLATKPNLLGNSEINIF